MKENAVKLVACTVKRTTDFLEVSTFVNNVNTRYDPIISARLTLHPADFLKNMSIGVTARIHRQQVELPLNIWWTEFDFAETSTKTDTVFVLWTVIAWSLGLNKTI